MKKIVLYLTIISLLLITFSCSGGGKGSSKGVSSVTILASFKTSSAGSAAMKAQATTLTNIRYTVSGSGMETMTGTVPVTGNLVEFTLNVPNGPQRHFLIEALDTFNTVRYKGEAYRDLDGTPVTIEITLVGDPLIGTWGYGRLRHNNDGTWHARSGKITFNIDGTGTDTFKDNNNGTLSSGVETFTYSLITNQDGSLNVVYTYPDRTQTRRYVISDDRKMMITDGTDEPARQRIRIFVKLDTSKTFSNADLTGEYYSIGYEHNATYVAPPNGNGSYMAISSLTTFDGNGTYTYYGKANSDGIIWDDNSPDNPNVRQYSVNPDGTISIVNETGSNGYIGGDRNLGIFSSPGALDKWVGYFFMKKGDRIYSTADLAGTWALGGFGDDYGTSFNAEFGTMTCDSSGNCVRSSKNQRDGNIKYESGNIKLSVSPDGSFGASLATGAPSYAGAIGNNGNSIVFNVSFDQSQLYHREIFIGVRCSNCSNLIGQMIPMLTLNPTIGGNGINIYLYDTAQKIMNTVKNNTNDSWEPSINIDQTMMVYTEGKEIGESDEPYTINIYDIASKTSTTLNTANTKYAAYFDKDGKILFLNIGINDNRIIKRMDSDGQNITTVATPQSPYTSFSVFWLSPDRQYIVAVEERIGDYERLVLMNSDGTGRRVVKGEYLGYWNMLSWKPDSSGFFYYHHVGAYPGGTPKYALINLDGSTIDLSTSDLGKEENMCLFIKSGNLLSLSYRELYNGYTGKLIASRPDVPLITEMLFGFDNTGEIYFAKRDGTDFRSFAE